MYTAPQERSSLRGTMVGDIDSTVACVFSVLQQGTPTRYFNMVVQQGTSTRYCNKARQQGTSTSCFNKVLQQGTSTRYFDFNLRQFSTRHLNKHDRDCNRIVRLVLCLRRILLYTENGTRWPWRVKAGQCTPATHGTHRNDPLDAWSGAVC